MKDPEQKQLEAKVSEFLSRKSYPRESLHANVSVRSPENKYAHMDLVIIDIYSKEYLAVFEFGTDSGNKKRSASQLHHYRERLNEPGMFAYYIESDNHDSFLLYELCEGDRFEKIEKEKFPGYDELIRLAAESKKIREITLNTQMLSEMEKGKRKNRLSAYFSIISIVIGVATAVLALFFQQGRSEPQELSNPDGNRQILDMETKLSHLQNQILRLSDSKKQSVFILGNDSVKIRISDVERRIRTIENGITSDPEKTLEVLSIRREIQLIEQSMAFEKEIMHQKIHAISERIETQNAWMLGILISIFGTILAIAIPNLLSHMHPQHQASPGKRMT